MRRLFLLLLLLNVVFFTWQLNRAVDVHDPYLARLKPGSREMQGVRTIYLLSEVGRTPPFVEQHRAPRLKPEPAVAILGAAEPMAAPPALCFRAGPFSSGKRASEVQARLGTQGIVATIAREDEPVATMQWVSLPPFDTFDAAKKQFAELQQRGVEDLGIVNERPGYVVSLGFYRQSRSASRRQDEISALGYQPRITDRLTTRQIFWLEFQRPTASGTNTVLPLVLTEALAGASSQPQDCAAANGKLADTGP
ncbi:MAG: hypothetical protein FD165_1633 [Gammaproteobacteria bacterium]|nr:MAG: hypothetical protein FD165_1633 [Gammaproteobacteria bacterium]TND02719.1 MAG: hypothetical protein FD120_2180 [Gammaproteobacteria bacterium]